MNLFDAHNAERVKRGKTPLVVSPLLTIAAQKHAEWMVENGMSHTGEGGSRPWDRAEKEGYDYSSIGENVAVGQKSVEQVMKAWMTSAGHKANILGKFQEIGIGIATNENGSKYWAVVFGTPR